MNTDPKILRLEERVQQIEEDEGVGYLLIF